MTDIEELMQLVIDGVATPQQESQLRALIERSNETREQFASLQAIERRLDAVPLADPPGIKQVVLAAIRPKVNPVRRPARRWFALAYAAAALVVIAFVVHQAVVPANRTSASMSPIDVPVVARATSAGVSMVIRRDTDDFLVEVKGTSAYKVAYDTAVFEPAGPGRLHRRPSAKGLTVIRLELPDHNELHASIDLR